MYWSASAYWFSILVKDAHDMHLVYRDRLGISTRDLVSSSSSSGGGKERRWWWRRRCGRLASLYTPCGAAWRSNDYILYLLIPSLSSCSSSSLLPLLPQSHLEWHEVIQRLVDKQASGEYRVSITGKVTAQVSGSSSSSNSSSTKK